MNTADEHFIVNWHTDQFALDPAKTYRIRVLVAQVEIGYADVDVVSSGGELTNVETGEFVALQNGRTLPIKFRIEKGLDRAAVVGSEGGEFTFAGGGVVLAFPPNALADDTPITVQRVQDVTGLLQPVQGPVFDFGPDGIVFDAPVTLTIGFNPSDLPPGVSEASLGIYRLEHDHPYWDPVSATRVDLSNHTVSGVLDGFTWFALDQRAEAPSALTYQFSHGSGSLQSSAEVGIWMLCRVTIFSSPDCNPDVLDINAPTVDDIADWQAGLLRQHEHLEGIHRGVIIHEPINVLWIDYASTKPSDAQTRVEEYLKAAGFCTELGVTNRRQHSTGYAALVDNVLIRQSGDDADAPCTEDNGYSGTDPVVAWVDKVFPLANNHGRIFPATNVGTTNDPVFYTLGAFSREDVGDVGTDSHRYLSFDDAQQKVLGGSAVGEIVHGWTYAKLDATWGNRLFLTTDDHKGVAILVRGGKIVVEVSATGENLDGEFTVLVDRGTAVEASFPVPPGEPFDLGGFPAGMHRIELTDVAANCTVPASQDVELANSVVQEVVFEVVCGGSGSGSGYASISASGGFFAHTCAVTTAGAALCWGSNQFGQLGNGSDVSTPTPVLVSGGLTFRSLSVAANQLTDHTCGVTTTGAAYCWGQNHEGQLGDGTTTDKPVPVAVVGGHVFSAVGAGSGFSCGIRTDGRAYCWGHSPTGQLGTGAMGVSSRTPAPVSGGLVFVSVSVGNGHTCGITASGAAYCWGSNVWGELGDGTSMDSPVPVAVAGGLSFKAVSASGPSGSHTCGVTMTGDAWCWGLNAFGQLGNGSSTGFTSTTTPVRVAGSLVFETLSAGASYTCGVTEDGTGYCWGAGSFGAPETCNFVPCVTSPVAVVGSLTFGSIAAGDGHTCGITKTGVAYCWGQNTDGQLGNGSVGGSTAVPTKVAGQP